MFDPFASWLPSVDVDVLCLQEVTRTTGLAGWTTFADGERELPQRADLHGDVKLLLPDHQAIFSASDAGPVSDQRGKEWRQDFGIGTYLADRLTTVGQCTTFVHGEFVEHQKWSVSERPRVAHAVRVYDRDQARFITIVHLHGLRDAAGKHDTPARIRQATRLVELIEHVREPADFTVVCGDLNLLPTSETFRYLRKIGLVDLVGMADTRTSAYRKPLRHANYMLVSDPSAVTFFEAPATPEVSDHRPLLLEL